MRMPRIIGACVDLDLRPRAPLGSRRADRDVDRVRGVGRACRRSLRNHAILSLTGNLAFVGADQLQALKALEGFVNRNGGIDGRPLSFVVSDDQSDVKTSLQIAQGLIAKNVPIILGPSSPQACAAIAPLLPQNNGPVLYCVANAGKPVVGGYEFLTLFGFDVQFAVTLRYFRAARLASHRLYHRNRCRRAGCRACDSDGCGVAREQRSADRRARALRARRSERRRADVAHQSREPRRAHRVGDRGRRPARCSAAPRTSGLDLPIVTSPGNLNAAFFKQYAAFLPTNLYFATVPYYANDAQLNPATKAAIADQTAGPRRRSA